MKKIMRLALLFMAINQDCWVTARPCCLKSSVTERLAHLVAFNESFDMYIAMDNCATNHIFGDRNDFFGDIIPMDPVEVMGLGEGSAVGYSNVKVRYQCDAGKVHETVLHKVWYLPSATIRMISVPQLDLQLDQTTQGTACASIFSCGRESIFKWGETTVTIPHRAPAGIPLLPCQVASGEETEYKDFHAAFTTIQLDMPERYATLNEALDATTSTETPADTVREGDNQPGKDDNNRPTVDVRKQVNFSEVIEQAKQLQAETLSKEQRELLSWHYHLGHLSFKQLQELAK